MIHTYKSASGKTTISVIGRDSDKVVYIILPTPLLESELERLAHENNCSIAVLSGLDWNDDLTPWPCKAIAEGIGPFAGEAKPFADYIVGDVVPRVENILGLKSPVRSLIGLSLSGLFAVWQWTQNDCFTNIASISGSFWYDNFAEWVKDMFADKDISRGKTGKALFYIGAQEGKSGLRAFADVRRETKEIVETLSASGINATLKVVEGGHHSPVYPRLMEVIPELIQ